MSEGRGRVVRYLYTSSGPGVRHGAHPYATVVVLYDASHAGLVVGISRCSPSDQFRRSIGLDIALGRARARAAGRSVAWTARVVDEGQFWDALAAVGEPYPGVQCDSAIREFCARIGAQMRDYSGVWTARTTRGGEYRGVVKEWLNAWR